MRRINAGVRVRNDKISVLLYAEDVVVMSESVDQLQSLLDVMIDHGRDSELQFSSEKSKVMIVKRSEDKSNAVWRIGENELKQVKEYQYLGMWVNSWV